MIKEIRIYWRLRPYIKKLKELSHMKFSWNLVVQIIATIIQALNQLSDLFPEDTRTTIALIVGVLQAVVALLAHYANPDGTSSKLAYTPKKTIKLPSVFAMMLLFPLAAMLPSAQAQEKVFQDNVVFVGGVYNADNTPAFKISTAYRKLLSGPVYTFTFWDVSGIQFKPLNVSEMQYTGSVALTTPILKPSSRLSIWVMGEAGLVGTTDVATGSAFGGGGYLDIDWGNNIRSVIMPKVVRNTLTGTTFELRIYPIGLGF